MDKKKLVSLKEAMVDLKKISEDEAKELAINAEITPEKDDEEVQVAEEDDNSDEILKKIELATDELEGELDSNKLSDELKESVKKFLKLKEDEIRSDLNKEYADKMEEYQDDLVGETDNYLTKVAEDWLEQNKIALKESVQVQRVQNFVRGFKKLLEENNIELPADAEAEIEKYKDENDELKDELNGSLTENYKLKKALKESKKALIVEKTLSSKAWAATKADKFRSICEGIEYDGDEDKFEDEIEKEVSAIDEEDTVTTTPSELVVDKPEEIKNSEFNLEEALKKIRK